jgi:trans-aconitate methyltransferase
VSKQEEQYTRAAERWSETQYADAESYLRHRAELVVSLGPELRPGDRVLDLACGDGGLGVFLGALGLRYQGVDSTPAMVEEARRKGIDAELGDLNDYAPPEPVEATTCFRAIYYTRDRAAFFRHVAGYTTRKLVFDLNPRQYRVEDVRRELHAAGLTRVELRPFFAPQNLGLPGPAAAALHLAERSGPLARLALRFRFSSLVSAAAP